MDIQEGITLKELNLCHNEMIRCVFRGYQVYEKLLTIVPALSNKQMVRIVRSNAIEQQFEDACLLGRLPFICEKKLNASRGAVHVELSNNGLVVTISSVSYPRQFPRPAKYREHLISSCQGDLFEQNPLDALVLLPQKRYLILTHCGNGSQPTSVCLGSPHPDGNGWKYITNLMDKPYDIQLRESEKVVEIEEAVLKLKDKYSNYQDRKNGEGTN